MPFRLQSPARRALSRLFARTPDTRADEELHAHLEMLADDLVRGGMTRSEAERQAQIRLGGIEQVKESMRDQRRWSFIGPVVQDIGYAVRIIRHYPGFTLCTVLTLALAIGANTAAFSAISAFLINPVSVPESGRLVFLETQHTSGNRGAHYRDVLDWRSRNRVFINVAVAWGATRTLTGFGAPERTTVGFASAGFWDVLGVTPVVGRFFREEDDLPSSPGTVVLTRSAWKRRFGGSAGALGRLIVLDGRPHTIVGVMREQAYLPGYRDVEFWLPLRANPLAPHRGQQYRQVVARLKPGVALARARSEMTGIARSLEQEDPSNHRGWSVSVVPVIDVVRTRAAPPIALLYVIVLFVLILSCANAAGLMLGRASKRAREMAVRASLGASRSRLVRQVLTESLVMSGVAGLLGVAVARCLLAFVARNAPPDLHLASALRIDTTVLALTFVTTGLTGLVFGMAPAWFGSRVDLIVTLKGSGVGLGVPRSGSRILSGIVVGEVALALVLLICGGLLGRDFIGLVRTEVGIRTDHLLTFSLDLPTARYTADRAATFHRDLVERLESRPGVTAVSLTNALPMSGFKIGTHFEVEGSESAPNCQAPAALLAYVTPGYFRALGIPLLRGNDLQPGDSREPFQVVVDELLASRCFPNHNPLGRAVRLVDGFRATIVGVVASVRHDGPWYAGHPQMYFPLAQHPSGLVFVAVRSEDDPTLLQASVRETVHGLDPSLPVERMRPMDEVSSESLRIPRMLTSVIAAFGVFGLLLVAIGLYGVVAYAATARTHEIAVRVAIGATRRDVLVLVLRRAMWLAVAGVLCGMAGAWALARAMSSVLVGVSPHDPGIFAAIALTVLGVALAAGFAPARTAATLDPVTALKGEA